MIAELPIESLRNRGPVVACRLRKAAPPKSQPQPFVGAGRRAEWERLAGRTEATWKRLRKEADEE